jgi:surface polysaccharide O-acyltransferase-like enzyme
MHENRDLSFDAFRGFAIIGVIAIHASLLTFPSTGGGKLALVAYQQLLNFSVPAFVFISGYWLSKEPIGSLQDYKKFLTKRLSRVLIPYFLWSFVYIAYVAIKTRDIDIRQIIHTFLTGAAYGDYYYWFIIMISQFYIITPVLQYLNRKRYGLILVLIVNILALLSRYISRLYLDCWLPSAMLFYSWIILFQFGLLVGSGDNNIFKFKRIGFFILPAILVSLACSQLEAFFMLSKYDNMSCAISPLKYSSLLYAVCVIFGFLFVRERFKNWPKLLVISGQYSLGIYLIHVIILGWLINIFQEISIVHSFLPIYQVVLVAGTLLICLIFIGATRKLLPGHFCSKILGF